jgi:hypothetical protein
MMTLLERVREWWQDRRTHQITAEKVRERVERGATYLDDVDPAWYRRVDAETLELEDGRHCILGQLHGEFRLGLGRSHLITMSSAPRASLSPVAYGFKCVEGMPEPWQARDYDLLNEAWREAVRVRQENDPTMSEDEVIASGDSVPADAVELEPAHAA